MDQAEAFVQGFDAPGVQFVDAGTIYRDVFVRLVNTNMTALPPEEQIAISTGALLTVEPYVTRDILRVMELQLARAGREYVLAIRRGETTISFPVFLEQLGYADAL